ncbi:MAG: hypothetical protein LN589_05320 [Rickettsia endosymbiont of Eriopis connexa]|nr:hypothetical protein [Rickettsia endosymbiont of Eriopis connexa]
MPLQNNFKVLDVTRETYYHWFKRNKNNIKKRKCNSTENIETLKVNTNEAKTVKIAKEDLEKSFELYEEKLIILAQNLSSQSSTNIEYQYVKELGEIVPTTEL